MHNHPEVGRISHVQRYSKISDVFEMSMFYPLVNVHKKLWKDPPCFFLWVFIHYFNGHFQ
jgi:hypothetical protein